MECRICTSDRQPSWPRYVNQRRIEIVLLTYLLYATSAWWGFTSASDRQRIEAFVDRAKRYGLCHADQPPVTQLVEDTDNYFSLCYITHNILYTNCYQNGDMTLLTLRPRRHDLTPSLGSHCIFHCNFIVRKLFKDSY